MSNEISTELKREFFKQESGDPFLTLITMTNPAFTHRLVNNSSDISSNGFTFTAFPMKIRLPVDDGESARDFTIELDNVSLELIASMRGVTDTIGVKIEMVLASMPDVVQISYDELVIRTITYNASTMIARIVMDNFLAVEMTGERYLPGNFPGLF